jgi:hypothetical protein
LSDPSFAASGAAAPPLAAARGLLQSLRESDLSGEILPEQEILPGLRFVPDPEAGMRGRYTSPSGRLLELEVTHAAPARWFGLHLRLDLDAAEDIALIGLAARFAARQALPVRPCIRSGSETGFVDSFFDKTVAALPRPLLHLDAIETKDPHPALAAPAPWRELVLFLPTGDFRLDLHDLRVFAA